MEYESDNISGAETYLTTFIKKNSKDPLAPSAAIMLSDIFMGSDNVDDALKMVNKALKNIGTGIGTIAITPSLVSLIQSCQNDATQKLVTFSSC